MKCEISKHSFQIGKKVT
jgi:hypothetical protein